MTNDWPPKRQSILMYLESCMVDAIGKIDHRRMNLEDVEMANNMDEEGLIDFNWNLGRIRFTDKAWELAHRFRKERANRMILKEATA